MAVWDARALKATVTRQNQKIYYHITNARISHQPTPSRIILQRHLLLSLHFLYTIHEIFVRDLDGPPPERQHPRLYTNSFALRAIEFVAAPGKLLKVDILAHRHFARVDLQNTSTGLLIGQRELNLAVQSAGTQQRRVQDVDSVCGCNYLDTFV
ncbi:hypothetical protein BC937DRAFT_90921 [Endogone sp. FLAS-F59071]|nr:hypothetical protein BC937DRAFT_90921 [Endogone sp. FLAS-F59071]|eukprot:RUS16688.1 hypothetical protein BC937DRAFT_90921 [Endogone sp. FLAS-F59071]